MLDSERMFVVVVPAYQCGRSIGDVVRGARQYVDRVVVVDDGSTDDTGERAEEAGAIVVRLPENRGKGFALRTGCARALEERPAALVLMDGDGQHAADDLPALCAAWLVSPQALVIGHRLHDPDNMPLSRYRTNRIGSEILSWVTGYKLLDSQSGYRILPAAAVRALDLRSNGYAIESEMLLKASRLGMPLEHVAVRTIYGNEQSHFRPVRDTTRITLSAFYYKIVGDA